MAGITIRYLDDQLKHRLRVRAAEHGHSMEEEVREIPPSGRRARSAPEPRRRGPYTIRSLRRRGTRNSPARTHARPNDLRSGGAVVILDTNLVSEMLRPVPEPKVEAWLATQSPIDIYMTAVSEAELRYDAATMPEGKRRGALIKAIEHIRWRELPRAYPAFRQSGCRGLCGYRRRAALGRAADWSARLPDRRHRPGPGRSRRDAERQGFRRVRNRDHRPVEPRMSRTDECGETRQRSGHSLGLRGSNVQIAVNTPCGFDRRARGLFGGPCFLGRCRVPDAALTAPGARRAASDALLPGRRKRNAGKAPAALLDTAAERQGLSRPLRRV